MELRKIGLLVWLFCMNTLLAQVKIGENPNVIDEASILELESASRALVISRVSAAEMQGIAPLQGAIVYNTTDQCVFYYDGGTWNNLCSNSGINLSFVDNGDGTYTIDIGNGPVTFNGAPESISTLVDNGDGSYTYTDETGGETTIVSSGSGGTIITDNGDGTYTVNDGANPPFTFDGAPESVTTLVDNLDGTYTYTNETGAETIIVTGVGGLTGTPGSVFFASDTGVPTENNAEFFWDDVNQRLGIGTTDPDNELEVNGLIKTLRAQAGAGTVGFPGFHFTNNSNSGMFGILPGEIGLAASGQELIRLSSDQRVGIRVANPQATLHVGGDLIVDGTVTTGSGTVYAKNITTSRTIRRETDTKVALTDADHTIILEATVAQLSLPGPSEANKGHIYIIKDLGGPITGLNIPYRDVYNQQVFEIRTAKVLWLQSDGTEWQQIN